MTNRFFFIFFLVALVYSGQSPASPGINLGDFSMPEISKKNPENNFRCFVAMETDIQKNTFPDQMTRFPWVDPLDLNEEERHYEKIRSSENTFSCYGTKFGITVNGIWMVYALIGMSEADVDLHYEDTTISYDFEIDETFRSTDNIYFGGGISTVLEEIPIHDTLTSIIGMDLKYRHFHIEDDSIKTRGRYYKCSLDEIQLSLLYTIFYRRITPYCGLRISAMTGYETYKNETLLKQEYVRNADYREKLTWFKNTGAILGIGFSFWENISLNVETRMGDEKAITIGTAVFF